MELTLEDFIEMERIEHQYFLDENISQAQEAYKWYKKDKNSCFVIKNQTKVIGFVNILSLKKEIFDKIKFNEMNESEIKMSDLELSKDKYYNYLYFSTIAIDKDFKNIKTLLQVLNITIKKILEIVNQGYKIKEVMADCLTKEGEKISERFLKLKPFNKTPHNSTIYILEGEKFIENFKNIHKTKEKLQY